MKPQLFNGLLDERARLVQAIHQLPEVQARLIVLHYLQNHRLSEIAGILERTTEEISTLHHAALLTLGQLRFLDRKD